MYEYDPLVYLKSTLTCAFKEGSEKKIRAETSSPVPSSQLPVLAPAVQPFNF